MPCEHRLTGGEGGPGSRMIDGFPMLLYGISKLNTGDTAG